MTALFADRLDRIGAQNEFKIADDIARAEAMGMGVIRLNLGEPDNDSAQNINECAVAHIRSGNSHYCDPQGVLEFRKTIARFVSETRNINVSPDQVLVTTGGKPTIPFSFLTYVNPGDEVVYPSPGFPAYEAWANYSGAVPRPIHLNEHMNYRFDAATLAPMVNRKTKLLVINSPSNPTGGVLTREDLAGIARVMLDQAHPDFRILSDEVYEEFVFDGKNHHSIASQPGMQERTIILNCHSKTFAMTGWRIGYGVAPTREEAQALRLWSINIYSCTPPFIQMAAREALENPVNARISRQMRDRFQERRDVIVPLINSVDGLHCNMPGGAFYTFINVAEVCERLGAIEFSARSPGAPTPSSLFQLFALYKHGVATLDRSAFGVLGSEDQHYLRISLASDIDALKAGVSRLAKASSDVVGFRAFLNQPDLYLQNKTFCTDPLSRAG
jgi:aspartate/methionine/tyrosine aminotransferase